MREGGREDKMEGGREGRKPLSGWSWMSVLGRVCSTVSALALYCPVRF